MIKFVKARIRVNYQGEHKYITKMERTKKGNHLAVGNKSNAIVFKDKSIAFDVVHHIQYSIPSAVVVDLQDNELLDPEEDID